MLINNSIKRWHGQVIHVFMYFSFIAVLVVSSISDVFFLRDSMVLSRPGPIYSCERSQYRTYQPYHTHNLNRNFNSFAPLYPNFGGVNGGLIYKGSKLDGRQNLNFLKYKSCETSPFTIKSIHDVQSTKDALSAPRTQDKDMKYTSHKRMMNQFSFPIVNPVTFMPYQRNTERPVHVPIQHKPGHPYDPRKGAMPPPPLSLHPGNTSLVDAFPRNLSSMNKKGNMYNMVYTGYNYSKMNMGKKLIPKLEYYSTFRHYEELSWLLDDDENPDNWPGTEKMKPGETYDGIIRYFFTPLRALVFLTNIRVEVCLTSDNLPDPYSDYTLKDLFKPFHLVHVKLKEPLTFDVKNRPEVIISTDKYSSPVLHQTKTIVPGTPVFLTDTMAVIELADGDHQAQLFMNDLGLNSSYSPPYTMRQFFSKSERLDVEILRTPSLPKIAGYLARIPWNSAKREQIVERYPELACKILPLFSNKYVTRVWSFTETTNPYFRHSQKPTFQDTVEPAADYANNEHHQVRSEGDIIPKSDEECTISEFVRRIDGDLKCILKYLLLKTNVHVNPNKTISPNLAMIIYNFSTGKDEFILSHEEEQREYNTIKEGVDRKEEDRPPVVVVLGHVNHGKTSLYKMLCGDEVKEAGNITQSIRASRVLGPNPITLIDTPGHEIFSLMKDYSARIADIATVVISAPEGIQEQTIESIKLCQKLDLPFNIVVTKTDLATETSIEDIAHALAEEGVIVEQFGGTIDFITSTTNDLETSKKNVIDSILLQAAVADNIKSKTSDTTFGDGYVLDSGIEEGLGPYALIIIKNGQLRKGEYLCSASHSARVKTIKDTFGNSVAKGKPSDVLYVYGFESDSIPNPGEPFNVFKDERDAVTISEHNMGEIIKTKHEDGCLVKMEAALNELENNAKIDDTKYIPVLLKCANKGSFEPIQLALEELSATGITTTAKYKVIKSSVGDINDHDIQFALSNKAIIVEFNINKTKKIRKSSNVTVVQGDLIHELLNSAQEELNTLIGERLLGTPIGKAQILKVFDAAKNKKAAGCVMLSGSVKSDSEVRVMRDGIQLFYGKIGSLRGTKEDIPEALESESCGITIEDYDGFQPNDELEFYNL